MLAVGCVSVAPASFTTESDSSTSDLFECAKGRVNALGFTVVDASLDTGFLRAERNITEARNLLAGRRYYDWVSLSVYLDPVSGRSVLRVTAESQEQRGAGNREGLGTSPRLKVVAKEIVDGCAQSRN